MRVTRLNQIPGAHLVPLPSLKSCPSLFVLNSSDATLQGDTLSLTSVAPHSIIFSGRPVRSAGHQLTADIIAD